MRKDPEQGLQQEAGSLKAGRPLPTLGIRRPAVTQARSQTPRWPGEGRGSLQSRQNKTHKGFPRLPRQEQPGVSGMGSRTLRASASLGCTPDALG